MFKLQLIISFLVGGLLIALQTLFAERVPLKWRGVVLTIPTTMAMGLLFVGLAKSPLDTVEVARVIPAGLGVDYLYVMMFAVLSTFGLVISAVGSFVIFALLGALVIFFPPASMVTSIFLYGLPAIIAGYLIVEKLPQIPHIKPYPMNWKHIALRSLLGGSIVALIVFFSKTLGNVWGGLLSTFPAAFTSTFIIYYLAHGKNIIPAVAKSLFFPGAIGFIIYGWIAAVTFPMWGIWLGTLVAYAGTFLFFWLISFVKEKSPV